METRQLLHVPTGQYYNTRKDIKLALGISGTQFKHQFNRGTIKSITAKAHLDNEYNTTIK